MTEPTWPPGEPMDPATRARIQSRLDEVTRGDHARRPHRWLAPVGAAAAVAVIAATVGYTVLRPDPAPVPQPAGAPGSTSELPSVAPTAPHKPSSSPGSLPTGADLLDVGGSDGTCEQAAPRRLEGARQVASLRLPGGEAGVWVAGSRSMLCEDSGGIVTLHKERDVSPPDSLGATELGFSSSAYSYPPNPLRTAFVAGGSLPQGVTGIDYTFPDGHTEPAVVRTDASGQQWWVMGYVPTDGPLTRPGLNYLALAPVEVQVSRSDARRTVPLQWGRDDCAQVNHGC